MSTFESRAKYRNAVDTAARRRFDQRVEAWLYRIRKYLPPDAEAEIALGGHASSWTTHIAERAGSSARSRRYTPDEVFADRAVYLKGPDEPIFLGLVIRQQRQAWGWRKPRFD